MNASLGLVLGKEVERRPDAPEAGKLPNAYHKGRALRRAFFVPAPDVAFIFCRSRPGLH
jgi:hypothetical protein